MKKIILFLLLAPLLFFACNKDSEDLPETEYVMVKFKNNSGKDIEELAVSRAEIGALKKGKTSDYFQFDKFGEQFGYALVEAVGTIEGIRYLTSSACQGVCDTPSAPHGEWLDPGYYKVSVYIADDPSGNYLEFRIVD